MHPKRSQVKQLSWHFIQFTDSPSSYEKEGQLQWGKSLSPLQDKQLEAT